MSQAASSNGNPSRRRRVMHVVPDMGVGGLPRVVETLCRVTDPAQFECSVLCLNWAGEIAEKMQGEGYAVHDLPRPRAGKPDRLASSRIRAILRRERIEILHTHNTQAFMHGSLATVGSGVETLIHTDHARDFPDRMRYHVIERVLSTLAWRVVGVSEHTTENLHRYEWIPRRKLLTIANGIESGLFDGPVDRNALRARLGVPVDAELLIIGARLEPQKGIHFLIEAMALLAPKRPKLHLVIAGIGTLKESLEAQVRQLGLADRVTFPGVRLDMPELLRAVEMFVLPSLWEGLPMIVLEALAARCPIVATSVGGVPSAVRDGDTGLLVPSKDPAALAEAIDRQLRDPANRERMARNGRVLFDQKFSAWAMAQAYERLYRREGQ